MTEDKDTPELLHRREAIKRVSALLGGVALVGGSALWTGCADDRTASDSGNKQIGTFTPGDIDFLDEIADVILPTTSTPGAKAARVGSYMAVMVTDCYEPAQQETFRKGMTTLNTACQTMHQTDYMNATPAQRLSLLESLDKEAKDYMAAKKPEQPTHYFRMMKELSLVGYFTSEIGCTQALRYTETPGRFDPCVPYTKGEKSWASHA